MNVTSSSPVATIARTCRSAGRDRLAVDEEPAGAVAIGAGDEPAVAEKAWCAGHQLDPRIVVIDEQHGRLAGRGIDGDDLDRTLVA